MREWDAAERDAQVVHMREVRLCEPTRLVELLEDDILLRAVEGAPGCNMALKGAELALGVAILMPLKQQREERFGLQCRVALEVLLDPGPVGEQGPIGTRFHMPW